MQQRNSMRDPEDLIVRLFQDFRDQGGTGRTALFGAPHHSIRAMAHQVDPRQMIEGIVDPNVRRPLPSDSFSFGKVHNMVMVALASEAFRFCRDAFDPVSPTPGS
jgi:hypothetical protein